jgi:hypothetical protein
MATACLDDDESSPQGNALIFMATVIRTIPCWVPANTRGNFYLQWTRHVGILLLRYLFGCDGVSR